MLGYGRAFYHFNVEQMQAGGLTVPVDINKVTVKDCLAHTGSSSSSGVIKVVSL